MSKRNDDFVKVQLSAAGRKLAGEGELQIRNRHFEHAFTAGKPVKVERRYEWTEVLSRESHNGETLFEIVPDAAPATTAPTATEKVKTEETR